MSKKCKLCGKTFDNSNYNLFGRSCFKNICKLLEIEIPKNIKENKKEKYLFSAVAKRLNKKGLTTKQREYLTELYIITIYIDKIEYINLGKLKQEIQKQIEGMNIFTGILLPNKDLSMVLYSIYNLYNSTETFKKNLAEIEEMFKNGDIKENAKKDKEIINYFKYIFNVKKIFNPKDYALNYYKQYVFWETVINVGLIFNYKLAAKLLKHSLSEIGENPKKYNITDKSIIEEVKEDIDFNNKLKEIIKNYKDDNYFKTSNDIIKETFAFENNTDLKFAIHNAEIIVEGNKNQDGTWYLQVEILDRFDFTDFVFPEEYDNKYQEINKNENKSTTEKTISSVKNGLGYTLNNMALASVQYGVLKEYDLKINFDIENYKEEGD